MTPHLVRLLPILLASLLATASSLAAAADSGGTIEGVHVHRSMDSPTQREISRMMLEGLPAQCLDAKRICDSLMADGIATSRQRTKCSEISGRFTLEGDPDRIHRTQIHEYFAPGPQWAAKVSTTHTLRVHSLCKAAVVEEENVVIKHHTPQGYTTYTRRDDPNRGHRWTRTEHPRLAPEIVGLLFAITPMSDPAIVSEPLGRETHGRHACEIRSVTLPRSSMTVCLAPTRTPFPGSVAFSGRWVATGQAHSDVMIEERLESYSDRVALPIGLFHPPASEPVVDSDTLERSPDNATWRWCQAEAARTGVNPCEDDDGDDDDD